MVRAFGKCVRVCHKDFYGVCVFDCALAHYYGLVFNIGRAGNTNGGSITVPLTSCLTDLESAVWQSQSFYSMMTINNFCFYLPNRLIQTIDSWCLCPNQSNRRSMVQWYFPLLYSLGRGSRSLKNLKVMSDFRGRLCIRLLHLYYTVLFLFIRSL